MDGYLIKDDDLKIELEEDYLLQTDNKTEIVGALLHKCQSSDHVRGRAPVIDKLFDGLPL
jgi:hypothetical protein